MYIDNEEGDVYKLNNTLGLLTSPLLQKIQINTNQHNEYVCDGNIVQAL